MYERNDFKWIVLGGSILAAHSGFVNTCGLRSVFAYTVTHVTGLVTKAAFSIVEQQWTALWNSVVVLFGFAFGAFLTGIICGSNKFRLRPRYGVVLMLESITLYIAVAACSYLQYPADQSRYAFVIMATAVGMQNAMFTSFSGAVVRTSHLTGLVNDTCMLIGQYVRYKCIVRKKQAETWKLLVFFPLLSGFLMGCIIGDYAFDYFSYKAILFPATSIGILGLGFFIFYKIHGNKEKKSVPVKAQLISSNIDNSKPTDNAYVDLENTDNDDNDKNHNNYKNHKNDIEMDNTTI